GRDRRDEAVERGAGGHALIDPRRDLGGDAGRGEGRTTPQRPAFREELAVVDERALDVLARGGERDPWPRVAPRAQSRAVVGGDRRDLPAPGGVAAGEGRGPERVGTVAAVAPRRDRHPVRAG